MHGLEGRVQILVLMGCAYLHRVAIPTGVRAPSRNPLPPPKHFEISLSKVVNLGSGTARRFASKGQVLSIRRSPVSAMMDSHQLMPQRRRQPWEILAERRRRRRRRRDAEVAARKLVSVRDLFPSERKRQFGAENFNSLGACGGALPVTTRWGLRPARRAEAARRWEAPTASAR